VSVEVESIYCQAKWSGGKRLPDLGWGGALPVGDSGGAMKLGEFLSLAAGDEIAVDRATDGVE
jgi:hypothetical protein